MHKSLGSLSIQIAEASKFITIGASYSHYKDETSEYLVEGFVVTEFNDEICVLYSSKFEPAIKFVRPTKSWLEKINNKPRFSLKEKDFQ